MARKGRTKKDRLIEDLSNLNETNSLAIKEGPKKKSWSVHDLKNIKPLNEAQRSMFEAYFDENHIVASGSAGTGKSFIALYLALNDLLTKGSKFKKIIIVRSAVPSRDIGFLPGSIDEKMSVYETPYKDIFSNLLGKKDAYDSLKENEKLVFMPTSYVRGLTWDDSIVLVDEAQNLTISELNSVMTRIGDNTKVIICGDIAQNDLVNKKNDISGFIQGLKIFHNMDNMQVINFTEHDIVRSTFVKKWISEYQKI